MSWYERDNREITSRHKKKVIILSYSIRQLSTIISSTKAGQHAGTYYWVSLSLLSSFSYPHVGKQWDCDIVVVGCKLDGLLRVPWWIVLSPLWFISTVLFSVDLWNRLRILLRRTKQKGQRTNWIVSTLYGSVVLFETLWILWLDGIGNISLLTAFSPLCIWSMVYLGRSVVSLFYHSHPLGDVQTIDSIDIVFSTIVLITTAITYDYVNLIPNCLPPIVVLLHIVTKLTLEVDPAMIIQCRRLH